MKKVFVTFVLLLVLLCVSLVSADTDDLPGAGWTTGQQIQNVGDSDATIVLTAYDQDGDSFACDPTDPNPMPPGKSFTWLPNQCSTPAGFEGSAVASSDQPIVAVVAVANNGASGAAAGQYNGTDGGDISTSVAFPLSKNDHAGRTTTFYIQNASSDLNDLTATFKDLGGTEYTASYPDIPANAMVIVNPSDAGVPTGTGPGLGSLVVTGTGPLAGASLEHQTTATLANSLQASRGFVPNDYDSTANCPLVRRNQGSANATTGIQAQNATTDQTFDISVTYEIIFPTARTVGPVTVEDVGPGESANFLQLNDLAAGEIGAATVTGGGDIAVIVNDRADAFTPQRFTTYACFGVGNATSTVAIPLAKDRFANNTTGIQVANVGGAPAEITLNYVNFNGTNIDVRTTVDVEPGASKTFLNMATGGTTGIEAINGTDLDDLLNGPFGDGNGGIAGVTITSDQPIVAIANEANYSGVNVQDTKNYEGFNLGN
jgi:uncharacterized cupredoxin-like copper-binding protein